jgi:predicted Abi (CAAX) family protease
MIQPQLQRLFDWFQRSWQGWGIALVGAIALVLLVIQSSPATSTYDLVQVKPFNQINYYPIQPLPSSPNFRPNGDWLGRLILPSEQEYAKGGEDWAWFEVWHSPEITSTAGKTKLLGQKIKLTWQPNDENRSYLKAVTRDVNFGEQAQKSIDAGNVLPTRLNGRKQVGPLQSLAGARPKDDVTVRLFTPQVELVMQQGKPVLQTNIEPFQVTGREVGLVTILKPDPVIKAPLPAVCPGAKPCPTEYFQVQHFNRATKDFSGAIETIRIPQQPMIGGQRFNSNIRDLEHSPAGTAGWYVYGSRDRNGIFTVQALKPRSLFQLQPDQVINGTTAGLRYINEQNWKDEPQRKGTIQKVLVSPDSSSSGISGNDWKAGDVALIIHLFGGVGGDHKEPTPGGTVTGHFAYGLAIVEQEPIAQELQFQILYQQVYAHNLTGIVSGTHDWSSFMGDMQRGWLGLRPTSDVLVKFDAFTNTFTFGKTTVSLFGELLKQAQVLSARYRIGDGTGVAAVTPFTSCVQDSNQALYIAMEQIKQQIHQNSDIIQWLEQHPNHPDMERLKRFGKIGTALEAMLTPYSVVRPDWQKNAEVLAGIAPESRFTSPTGQIKGLFLGILSWRSMMPRWAHDEVSQVFLRNGAHLWFLRTNSVGGNDPAIEPIPPTTLFGLIPGVGKAVQRLTDAFVIWPNGPMVWLGALALGLYALLAIPFGLKTRFLKRQNAITNPMQAVLTAIYLFFLPALVEEIFFRVMLLPHPLEGVPAGWWLFWALVNLVLFVLYHWVQGKFFRQHVQATLCDRRFLLLAGWLGFILISLYQLTGSLWLITSIHWLVVLVWIFALGGYARMLKRRSG